MQIPLPLTPNRSNEQIANAALVLGAALLGLPVLLQLAAAVAFAASSPISRFHFPVVVLLCIGLCAFAARRYLDIRSGVAFFVIAATFLVMVVGATVLAGRFYDTSWDGQTYHQAAIASLVQGWNPFLDDPVATPTNPYVAINNFAKGSWITAAALVKFTGHVEQGKAFNLLLNAAAFLLAFAALMKLEGSHFPVRAALFAILSASNPVAVYQSLSFYVDGQLAAALTCLLALLVLVTLLPDDWFLLVLLAAAILLLVNIKVTGLLYAFVLTAAWVFWLFYRQRRIQLVRMGAVIAAGFLVGVFLAGFSPYVTNLSRHKNPVYPFLSPDGHAIIDRNMPANFYSRNRVEKLALSIFSRSENVAIPQTSTLKFPFTVSREEIDTFRQADVRVGGFGPLFGGVLLLAAATGLLALIRQTDGVSLALVIVVILLVSALSTPEAWWARYAPQLWLIPVLISYHAMRNHNLALILLSVLLSGVLALNLILIGPSHFQYQKVSSQKIRQTITQIQKYPQPVTGYFNFISERLRFEEAGIQFREVESRKALPCTKKLKLEFSGSVICSRPK